MRERCDGIVPSAVTTREALSRLPVLRKSDLPALQQGLARLSVASSTGIALIISPASSPRRVRSSRRKAPRAIPGASARAMHAMGIRRATWSSTPSAIISCPAGFIMDAGARALGCAVIPAGPGNTEQQLEAIAAFRPTVYCGTPDFLKILIKAAAAAGRDVSSIKLALVSGAAFPKSLQDEDGSCRHRAFQAYATADVGIIAFETLPATVSWSTKT